MDPDLDLFADVVAAGSLSAAARAHGVSAATVSKRLARLESRLGVRLLHRTTRSLALTSRGSRFHDEIVGIRAALIAAKIRLTEAAAGPSGPLAVTAPTSFGRLHVAPHLGAFLDVHPTVRLTLDLSDAYEDLAGPRFDIAIRITDRPSMAADRLADSPRLLCAAPTYVAAHGAPAAIDQLDRHRLLAAQGQLPWRLSSGDGATYDLAAESRVLTNSSEVVRELALAGVGIALRSMWDVSVDLAAGRLVRVLPDWRGAADVGIYAIHAPGSLLPAAAAMVAHLRGIWAKRLPTDAAAPR